MPICQICNTRFPVFVTIEGKPRNLCNRRRCLNCHPFKDGTRYSVKRESKDGRVKEDEEKTCLKCGRNYSYSRKNRRGHGLTLCNSCKCNANRNDKKERAVAYLGGCCVLCGYNKCPQALSFHHINGDKDFTISARYGCSWGTLKNELDKCVLVCQNCHQELHYGVAKLQ